MKLPELWTFPPSTHSRKVCFTAFEKHYAFELKEVKIWDEAPLPEEFLNLTQFKRIPVLVDGDSIIHESSIICEYIDQKTQGIKLFPANEELCLKVRCWDSIVDSCFVPISGAFFFNFIKPEDKKDYDAVMEVNELASIYLQKIEDELKDKDYLIGKEFTFADIAVVTTIYSWTHTGLENFNYINTHNWIKRIGLEKAGNNYKANANLISLTPAVSFVNIFDTIPIRKYFLSKKDWAII